MTQPKQTKRHFFPEFKLEAIEQVVKYQRSTIEVACAPELDPSQLRKWIRQYKEEVSGVTSDNPALTPIGTMVYYRPVNTKSSGKRLRRCPDFVIHYRPR